LCFCVLYCEGLEDTENLDTSSTDILFGFEHLIRELGQLYEAIVEQTSMVDSETYEVAKKFPLIPAKLLMMGLPFELMNGDIQCHVCSYVLPTLEHEGLQCR
jgi:hypothetical protein